MTKTWIDSHGLRLPLYSLDTLVIGSGCAGYNAADWLNDLGREDIAVLSDGKNRGTSRNAGSDKQTYYKLSLGGDAPDSVPQMAADLFAGGGMHGDHALAQAACSARCFYKLANLGVPFPANEFGEYVGYRTDHDDTRRATSAGPLTSKYMTEALENSVAAKGVPLFDDMMALRLLTRENALCGVIALDLTQLDSETFGLTLFNVNHAILATGGPAGVYHHSAYPHSQAGMTGMALEAGAGADNLMSWQYGLASTKFRWNVSGAYQQVIPRYISVGDDGEREFLSPKDLDFVFLKGYEWPYDPAKPSSRIDQLVHREIHEKGRRVFLDYRSDPTGLDFSALSAEATQYLERSGALCLTPIARLEKMNPQAIALYLANGIDLRREPLEIGLCAQHCNGGVAVGAHWQSGVPGLYAAGEAAGTFGSQRPGGAALNAAQVGSMRAAQHIARQGAAAPAYHEGMALEAARLHSHIKAALAREGEHPTQLMERCQKEFSAYCAHMRRPERFDSLYQSRIAALAEYFDRCAIPEPVQIPGMFLARDILLTQAAMLSAMRAGEGSGVVHTRMEGGGFVSSHIPARPIPKRETWFETVWEDYRT
ncbi:MAG: FAD-binding protein [Firmicutes bacterium]|nr:FAD-binding protein [Bacillota bacterium]